MTIARRCRITVKDYGYSTYAEWFGDKFTNLDEETKQDILRGCGPKSSIAAKLARYYLRRGEIHRDLLEACCRSTLADLAKQYINNCKICAIIAEILHDKCIEDNVMVKQMYGGSNVVDMTISRNRNISPFDPDPCNPRRSTINPEDYVDLMHELRLDQK